MLYSGFLLVPETLISGLLDDEGVGVCVDDGPAISNFDRFSDFGEYVLIFAVNGNLDVRRCDVTCKPDFVGTHGVDRDLF